MAEMRQLHEKPVFRERFKAWRYRTYERIGLMRKPQAEREALRQQTAGLTMLSEKELVQLWIELHKKADGAVIRRNLWITGLVISSVVSLGMAINFFMAWENTQKLLGGLFAALCIGFACAADIVGKRREDAAFEELKFVMREQCGRMEAKWEYNELRRNGTPLH